MHLDPGTRDGGARLEMTPMMDVVFLLLVFFIYAMVTMSVHRGIDVARALGHEHVAGCTGSTSERVVTQLYDLPETCLLDMGDFVGAVLKHLRRHPDAKIGDPVVLWGRGLPVEEVAQHAGTIGYELTCGITRRVRFVEDDG